MIAFPINNPKFEDGWREWNGIHELKVANSWQPWWHHNDTRPEYKIATPEVDPRRIYAGVGAQQWFTTHATHTAGIYQIIHDILASAVLHFIGQVQAFSSDADDFSKSAGRYRMRLGIDPYGGMDPESKDIAWSETVQPYDAYERLEVIAEARSDRCTLFVWGQAEWAVKHNNGYIDDVGLYIKESIPPDPEPGEGVTEARVIELATQAAEAVCSIRETQTMRKLGELILEAWPT